MIAEFKKREVELFGRKFTLQERTAKDVMDLAHFMANQDRNNDLYVYAAVRTATDALKNNYKTVSRWRIFQRRKIKKMTSLRYLHNNLAPRHIFELQSQIMELEGLEENSKKKATEKQSEETAQTPSSPTFLK